MTVVSLIAALAQAAGAEPIDVDVELVLMVDASRSMGPTELWIQRRGYAEALASDEVVDAVVNGGIGAVSVTYIEWGGSLFQRVILPWTLIDSRESAQRAAGRLQDGFELSMQRLQDVPYHLRQTSISGAVHTGQMELERNQFEGLRKVIDISGNGPNNDGDPVSVTRDIAVAAGVIINGLPLISKDAPTDPENEDLDIYFSVCVIGGPGAFVLPVQGWSGLASAVRRKLVLELANNPESNWRTEGALARQVRNVNCLIGEHFREIREKRG